MPTAMRWQVKAPDGTKTLHRTLRDALANCPQGARLKRTRVNYAKK